MIEKNLISSWVLTFKTLATSPVHVARSCPSPASPARGSGHLSKLFGLHHVWAYAGAWAPNWEWVCCFLCGSPAAVLWLPPWCCRWHLGWPLEVLSPHGTPGAESFLPSHSAVWRGGPGEPELHAPLPGARQQVSIPTCEAASGLLSCHSPAPDYLETNPSV